MRASRSRGPFNGAYLSGAVDDHAGRGLRAGTDGPSRRRRGRSGAVQRARHRHGDRSRSVPRRRRRCSRTCAWTSRSAINHNTWVRNREANVEMYTDDPLAIHAEEQAFALTGVVTTDRGEYNFLEQAIPDQTRLGDVHRQTGPQSDAADHRRVSGAGRGARDAEHSGADRRNAASKPKLSLESDAQPPKTQSELLSLLAFGQPSTSLLAFESSSIAGSAATCDLFGVGAQLAVQAARQRRARRGGRSGRGAGRTRVRHRRVRHHARRRAGFRGSGSGESSSRRRSIEAGKYINAADVRDGAQEQGGHRAWRSSIEPRTGGDSTRASSRASCSASRLCHDGATVRGRRDRTAGSSSASGASSASDRELVPQRRHRAHALEVVLFAHPLVRRVRILARQSEADEQHRRVEYSLKVADHGDRAALAGDHRLARRTPSASARRAASNSGPSSVGAPRPCRRADA